MARKPKYKPCPKCGKYRKLTRHHIMPKRWFGKGKKNNHILLICKECHQELERRIPFSKMPKTFYNEVVNEFLGVQYARV